MSQERDSHDDSPNADPINISLQLKRWTPMGKKFRAFQKYLILFWLGFIVIVLAMAATKHVYSNGTAITGTPKRMIMFLAKLPQNVLKAARGFSSPLVIESPNRKHGFSYSNKYAGSKDYLLLSIWDETLNQSLVKLVRIHDGAILHKWIPDIDSLNDIFNSSKKEIAGPDLNRSVTLLFHPYLLPDGSLIFSAGGIFRIDKDSRIVWGNPSASHHSIEPDSEGNVWFCGVNSSPVNMEKFQIRDESIKQISIESGEVLFQKSVFEILMENGYGRGNFFNSPNLGDSLQTNLDYVHLNDVQPVLEDSKYWKRGDVFVSLRHQNLVFLYRPSSNKMIWHKKGPWLKQHDVDVIDSTRIGIFGNDVIDAHFDDPSRRLIDGHNHQYVYDFSNGTLSTPYETFFRSSAIGTITQGTSRILDNGLIYVEETKSGKLLLGDSTSAIWTYTEKIDDKKVSMLGWCRYITEEEFKSLTFLNGPQ